MRSLFRLNQELLLAEDIVLFHKIYKLSLIKRLLIIECALNLATSVKHLNNSFSNDSRAIIWR